MTYAIENNLSLPELRELFQMQGSDVVWKTSRNPKIKVGHLAGSLLNVRNTTYRQVKIKCRSGSIGFVLAHVVAFALSVGRWPVGIIDHKDGNGLNNSPNNLRESTTSQNSWNRGKSVTNTSGFKNISFDKLRKNKPYQASVKADKKHVLNTWFATLEEAVSAARDARIKHHGDFARHD